MIRPYSPDDKTIVLSIWRETSAFAHPFLTPEFTDQAEAMIRDVFLDMAEVWIAEQHKHSVGFIALIGNEIGGLFLRPEYHGLGIGRALMDHALRQKGTLELEVFTQNNAGRRFYRRCGFVEGAERLDEASGQKVMRMSFSNP
ncbi:putative N-acetyltransferase YjaB [Roseovarius litorisediminis]|uniref:Putative N-acetyltransferase YjaB n=1 Tax=Roseovarius litorisediminis TaxID=1312363 RepID=A0A1Y5RS00_9RHOB|nr:GNAT family N-acetyltransferase [Roseovarius litorisediminis]SLN21191.1 putative N-acetyltransferase YjaB [Roseovarius litorisediminis]